MQFFTLFERQILCDVRADGRVGIGGYVYLTCHQANPASLPPNVKGGGGGMTEYLCSLLAALSVSLSL